MNLKSYYFLCVLIVVSSCGVAKKVNGSKKANAALSVKKLVSAHKLSSPSFATLAARMQVIYEDDKKSQRITVSLRIKKGDTIWIKASLLGITLSKVLITKDRVSYYETLGRTYFDGDFSLLSEWLGTEIDFEKAQALLLGQSLFSLTSSNYDAEIIQNEYRLFPKQQPQNFIHFVSLNPEDFRVSSGSLSQPNDDRLLSIRYDEYQNIANNVFPTRLVINASENESNKKFELIYKKIDLDLSIHFPFRIPRGYDEIQL